MFWIQKYASWIKSNLQHYYFSTVLKIHHIHSLFLRTTCAVSTKMFGSNWLPQSNTVIRSIHMTSSTIHPPSVITHNFLQALKDHSQSILDIKWMWRWIFLSVPPTLVWFSLPQFLRLQLLPPYTPGGFGGGLLFPFPERHQSPSPFPASLFPSRFDNVRIDSYLLPRPNSPQLTFKNLKLLESNKFKNIKRKAFIKDIIQKNN